MIPSIDFTTAQLDEITAALKRLRWEGEADCILLADITGQLIESEGNLDGVNLPVLSALAAGEVAATREMARLVGEEARFKLLLHEGNQQSVYLSDIDGELVLVALFRNSTPIGMVRLFTRMTVDSIRQILRESRAAAPAAREEFSADFGRLLSAELDASFKEEF